jgi:hypothetical protein
MARRDRRAINGAPPRPEQRTKTTSRPWLRRERHHCIDLERIYLLFLFDLGSTVLGRHDTIAVPKTLPRVLLQGSEDVLGVLLGLLPVERRDDLAQRAAGGESPATAMPVAGLAVIK